MLKVALIAAAAAALLIPAAALLIPAAALLIPASTIATLRRGGVASLGCTTVAAAVARWRAIATAHWRGTVPTAVTVTISR